eukprot:1160590-Pelagomonas_calceolata.AAC.11
MSCNSAHCTGSHQNLEYPMKGFTGSACQVSGWMVGWLAQVKNCQQKFPKHLHSTASHTLLTLQGCQAVLFGRAAKIPGRGVPWAGQGSQV